MGRIHVHFHGRIRERGWSQLIESYSQRLKDKGVKLEVHSAKLSVEQYLDLLLRKTASQQLWLLDSDGASGNDEWLLSLWKGWRLSGQDIHLAIGPVDGFPPNRIEGVEGRISLSPLIFTYEAACTLLLEQLYRMSEIERGSPYHRG
jgi:23S rRNA (pseudouridine1915-N3)-methyltransferase